MIGELTNHLWQSTLFAILAGLLTLAFRTNRAQVRYWLWFSASVKFLIPFSLLLALGGYLGRTPVAKSVPVPAITYTVVEIAEPFPQAPPPALPTLANRDWIPIAIFSLWALGLAGITLMRLRGWLRIRAAVRASSPMDTRFPVEVRSSPALLEPGVVGFFRPLLLCPAGIVERLTPTQLQPVLAHELCHIRRCDNLTAAGHMIVEALFWFHPLVWWISARLMEERERACDECVLESGSDRHVYAESILKTCQFCVESPLTCVPGVTGADLKKRIVRIMTGRSASRLDFGKRLLLIAVGVAAVAVPVGLGLLNVRQVHGQWAQNARAGSPFVGTWQSTFSKRPTVIKVSEANDRGLRVLSYTIGLSEQPLGGTAIQEGTSIRISIPALGSTYEGKLDPDGSRITGAWKQGPERQPLELKRATAGTAQEIPPPSRPTPMAADAKLVFAVASFKFSPPAERCKSFTVRGHRFVTTDTTVEDLMTFAYNVHPRQIAGEPTWLRAQKYDLDAEPEAPGVPAAEQARSMLKELLEDRCKLAVHPEKKELPVYAMRADEGGPKLFKSVDQNGSAGMGFRGRGELHARNVDMADLAGLFQVFLLDRPVVDWTSLPGRYDFTLRWTPDASGYAVPGSQPPAPSAVDDFGYTNLTTAMQRQLGLKLESAKAPVDVLFIEHIERPAQN